MSRNIKGGGSSNNKGPSVPFYQPRVWTSFLYLAGLILVLGSLRFYQLDQKNLPGDTTTRTQKCLTVAVSGAGSVLCLMLSVVPLLDQRKFRITKNQR